MRILQLHTDYIEYQPIEKEIELAEETNLEQVRLEEIVVLLTCIEKNDNETTANKAIQDILISIRNIGINRIIIYPYAHLSLNLAQPSEALKILKEMELIANNSKINVYRAPFGWTKSLTIKVKGHPLAEQSKTILSEDKTKIETSSSALKSEEKLVSHWYILHADGQLFEASSYSFKRNSGLEKLTKYEISKVRSSPMIPPHVTLMKKLQIADYEPGSDSGNMRYYPKGRLIKSLLEQFVTQKVKEYGGVEVETPIMYDLEHPSLASYLNRFPARQYVVKSENKNLFLRFSACFGQFLIAKDMQISYKHLPFKLYELTRYSFRREKSGEVSGLRRLRAFTMPDCHAICRDLDQAKEEVLKRFKLSMDVLDGIGLTKDDYELAMRFTKQFYDENKEFIGSLLNIIDKPCLVEIWDERFFYFVFKWEFNFVDNLDKGSALSTDQIDVENAERYGITYIDEKGAKKSPIILHNSPSGAIERCIYALLEKAFKVQSRGEPPCLPLWLTPTQIRLIPLNSNYQLFVEKICDEIELDKIRADIDDREETVSRRIRDAEKEWIPYVAVIGEKEVSSGILQIRDRFTRNIRNVKLEDLKKEIYQKTEHKPFQPLSMPRNLAKQPQFPS